MTSRPASAARTPGSTRAPLPAGLAAFQGWPQLITSVADEVVLTTVQDMHRAISRGAFRWVGPIGRPVEQVHDTVVGAVYGLVRRGLRGAGEVGAALTRRAAATSGGVAPTPSRGGLRGQAIAHGVAAEHIAESATDLDMEVTLVHERQPLAPDPTALRAAVPATGGELVVLLHGLVHNDDLWDETTEQAATIPEVAIEAGWTPVRVRYGTGRAIGRNAADLAQLLEATVAAWPVPVTRIVLVGHSMGGLLARAAVLAARDLELGWPSVTTDVIYLGTPHLGSWLEKVANVTSWTLRHSSSRAAPLGTLLDGRSRGIKDLRFGALDDTDYDGAPIDGLLTGRADPRPWDDALRHHTLVGRLREPARHPLTLALGDGLVRTAAAAGQGLSRRIDGTVSVATATGRHTRLTSHPEARRLVRAVLTDGREEATDAPRRTAPSDGG